MHSRRTFRIASCMAPNADATCRALAAYLASRLDLDVELVETVDWAGRERLLDAGAIDLCWLCGLPYIEKADRGAGISLCVAPVMEGKRYGGRAVYFSDFVVRSDSRYRCFDDLAGATVAYNEPRSHSGYNVVRYHLARQGRTLDYFGEMVEAGAHEASLIMIVSGEVAAAAIDSTVLDAEIARRPGLTGMLRTIHTVGPSPAPPWIFSKAVPAALRREVTDCLVEMHRDSAGARILASWGIAELRRVEDADYDAIRAMTRIAVHASAHSGARNALRRPREIR